MVVALAVAALVWFLVAIAWVGFLWVVGGGMPPDLFKVVLTTGVEFPVCVALSWASLSRYYWNRQCQSPVSVQSGFTEIQKRSWPHRLGRACQFVAYPFWVFLLVPFFLFHLVIDIQGHWALFRESRRLESPSESLVVSTFLTPPASPDENFFSGPFWHQFEYQISTNANDPPGTQRWVANAERDYSAFVIPYLSDLKIKEYNPKAITDGRTDFAAWGKLLRRVTDQREPMFDRGPIYDFPIGEPVSSPAEEVLHRLSKFDHLIEQWSNAVVRPRCLATLHPESGIQASFPHHESLVQGARIIGLRADARVTTGKSELAAPDVRLIFALADTLREEPYVTSRWVELRLRREGLQALWQGLISHAWSNAQLRGFQDYLHHPIPPERFFQSIRMERALWIEGLEKLRRGPVGLTIDIRKSTDVMPELINHLGRSIPIELYDPEPPRIAENPLSIAFFWVMPSGWIQLQQAYVVRHFRSLLYAATLRLSPGGRENVAYLNTVRKSWRYEPDDLADHLMEVPARWAVSRMWPLLDAWEDNQMTYDLAAAACALECFYLARHSYPTTLAELVPEFANAIPMDRANGKPLQYRSTPDGWFHLWSVGRDGRDDGGVFRSWNDERGGDLVWPRPIADGEYRLF